MRILALEERIWWQNPKFTHEIQPNFHTCFTRTLDRKAPHSHHLSSHFSAFSDIHSYFLALLESKATFMRGGFFRQKYFMKAGTYFLKEVSWRANVWRQDGASALPLPSNPPGCLPHLSGHVSSKPYSVPILDPSFPRNAV